MRRRRVRKCRRPFFIEAQADDVIIRSCGLILHDACLGPHYLIAGQDHIPLGIKKNQRAGLAQFLQDRIGIRNTGNIDVDPVRTFLVHLRLGAVILHPLLQLVLGIGHIRIRRIVDNGAIGNAHAPRQIQAQLDVVRRVITEPAKHAHAGQHDDQA